MSVNLHSGNSQPPQRVLQIRRRINFIIIALLLITFTSITHAQTQRTKIAIVGLVHSHCWGFVTKLNQMHQSGDLIEIVGISDDNQELRDYIKTLVLGVAVYDNYGKMLEVTFAVN